MIGQVHSGSLPVCTNYFVSVNLCLVGSNVNFRLIYMAGVNNQKLICKQQELAFQVLFLFADDAYPHTTFHSQISWCNDSKRDYLSGIPTDVHLLLDFVLFYVLANI